MKILNLYAGIGGNRALWGDEHQITSVELNHEIANVYASLYPNDELIIDDAHEYLLKHYKEFDFIWTSPPCQSHSSFRFNINVRFRGTEPKYPDMSLYQEIILLSTHFEGKYVVENVKPYYEPLIKPTTTLHRHLFWSNFDIPDTQFETSKLRTAQIPDLEKLNKVDLSEFKLPNKRQVLRNCVLPELGLHVFQHAQDPDQN
jgi:DNA (cytosine-5)-methyltransferase 1